MRSTIFSPRLAGRVETRRSMSRLPADMPMRPSWGRRRSVMSRPASTLMRAVIPLSDVFGGMGPIKSCSKAWTRKRTRKPAAPGSMWMSLDSRSRPAAMIRFTRRMASSPTARASVRSRSCSATVSDWNESGLTRGPPPALLGPASSSSLSRTREELKSSRPIAIGTTCTVCKVRLSSASAALSRGLTIATESTLPASFTGRRRKLRLSVERCVDSLEQLLLDPRHQLRGARLLDGREDDDALAQSLRQRLAHGRNAADHALQDRRGKPEHAGRVGGDDEVGARLSQQRAHLAEQVAWDDFLDRQQIAAPGGQEHLGLPGEEDPQAVVHLARGDDLAAVRALETLHERGDLGDHFLRGALEERGLGEKGLDLVGRNLDPDDPVQQSRWSRARLRHFGGIGRLGGRSGAS